MQASHFNPGQNVLNYALRLSRTSPAAVRLSSTRLRPVGNDIIADYAGCINPCAIRTPVHDNINPSVLRVLRAHAHTLAVTPDVRSSGAFDLINVARIMRI